MNPEPSNHQPEFAAVTDPKLLELRAEVAARWARWTGTERLPQPPSQVCPPKSDISRQGKEG